MGKKIAHPTRLKPDEKPKPGDIGAYKLSGGGSAYSGHTGVMIKGKKKGEVTNTSAHKSDVGTVPNQFQSVPNKKEVIYLRYTGE